MYNILQPFGPMIYHGQCSEDFLKFLRESLDPTRTEAESMAHILAGNIGDQFKLVAEPATFVEHVYPHILAYVGACHERHNEHVLDGGILCFPALWKLREKINKPLSRIHKPVKIYDTRVTRSVQRMFNNLKTNNPLWRANWYLYQDPELFSPLSEEFSHTSNKEFFEGNFWVRVERQTLMRLPETKSVVFGIHTYVVQKQDLLENQVTSLKLFSTKNNTKI